MMGSSFPVERWRTIICCIARDTQVTSLLKVEPARAVLPLPGDLKSTGHCCDKSVAKHSQRPKRNGNPGNFPCGVRPAIARQAGPRTAIDSKSLETMRRDAAHTRHGSEFRLPDQEAVDAREMEQSTRFTHPP
jgi:hypothetical protein